MDDAFAELSPATKALLRAAGWMPDQDRSRDVAAWLSVLEPEFPAFSQALVALYRYGGIHVQVSGPGEAMARQSFQIDPTLAVGEGDRFDDFSKMLGVSLFPLGEVGNEAFLAITEDGRVFALMLDLWFLGNSMEDAIEGLLRGRSAPIVIDELAYRAWIDQSGKEPDPS